MNRNETTNTVSEVKCTDNTQTTPQTPASPFNRPDVPWSMAEYNDIVKSLLKHGCEYIKGREEYTLLKEVLPPRRVTGVSITGNSVDPGKLAAYGPDGIGVNSDTGIAYRSNDTTPNDTGIPTEPVAAVGSAITDGSAVTDACTTVLLQEAPASDPAPADNSQAGMSNQSFLAPLDLQRSGSIAEIIPSFRVIQSPLLRLNIGFDTEFQYFTGASGQYRAVLCLTMSIALGDNIIRYIFLVDPRYQRITAKGGLVPLKYCLSDILMDFRKCYLPELPSILKKHLVYKDKKLKDHSVCKVLDFRAMKDYVIPVTLICHTGKADISVFRRSKYDVDVIHKIGEIQGGWMSTQQIKFKVEADMNYNYYYLIDLQIRDTLGLTPAENRSLKALGRVINRPKIELGDGYIQHMASFAVEDPISFFEYAVNDSDIVVDFVSAVFLRNHAIPMTLSSAAAKAMKSSITEYLGTPRQADYDRTFRGLELLDDGPSADQTLQFCKNTRYVSIQDNPDARLITEFFEEGFVGGFNASFYLGWITAQTTDFDLKNAYPSSMANIYDIDFSRSVIDFPREHILSLEDIPDPLIPAVAVGDFDFPDTCYCPNIPTPAKGSFRIYPRHGRNVYMTGPDMYLALCLGARIKIYRGFRCEILLRKDGTPSRSLAHAVTSLVQDRAKAKRVYPKQPLIEKSLKTMVCSCYGKTAQNVSPKTRYNALKESREAAEPSAVTSPYHAAYTTALVRCMLIACINQIHGKEYKVYSVTTDGFITDAPAEVLYSLDAYGFTAIFQEGRYTLNQTRDDIPDNHVWEPKHTNDTFLNITTRGNVAVNDGGVLAHNSYITGEEKDSRADRDAYIIAVLAREGKLKCPTSVWTHFAEIVEKKAEFEVTEILRQLSMNFDFKRVPVLDTAKDVPVHYDSLDGRYSVDSTIAEFDTRPFTDVEEFLNYRPASRTEDCVKVKSDLERVSAKANTSFRGYIGKDLPKKQLMSIIAGYYKGKYKIPTLDGLSQKCMVDVINSWELTETPIKISDIKNCTRPSRKDSWLPYEYVMSMLRKIYEITGFDHLDS